MKHIILECFIIGTLKTFRLHLTVYVDEDSWKRFVPSVRLLKDYGSGWAMVGDLLLCLPLSVFVQFTQINYKVSTYLFSLQFDASTDFNAVLQEAIQKCLTAHRWMIWRNTSTTLWNSTTWSDRCLPRWKDSYFTKGEPFSPPSSCYHCFAL